MRIIDSIVPLSLILANLITIAVLLFCFMATKLEELITKNFNENFKETCKEMERKGEGIIRLPVQGTISYDRHWACDNCGHMGLYNGEEMFVGKLYESASARYCPECETVYDFMTDLNFAMFRQERFLPVMKEKLIKISQLRPEAKLEDDCPECDGPTFSFSKNLGRPAYDDNKWEVCLNKSCDWPGKHYEGAENGMG
jgi:hypothetical protein